MELLPTEDGSYALYDTETQLHYRSRHGALAESTHVFLEGTGIVHRPAPWDIVELGFGGGFNFLLTAERFLSQAIESGTEARLLYHAVEMAPIDPAWLDAPGYDSWGARPGLRMLAKAALAALHTSGVVETCQQYREGSSLIELFLYRGTWQAIVMPPLQAMGCYHDPFGPQDNPDSWGRDCFAWWLPKMHPSGVLATYAAASQVRRDMVQAGFHVAKAPGSGRKREMTLASPSASALQKHPMAPTIIPRERYLSPGHSP